MGIVLRSGILSSLSLSVFYHCKHECDMKGENNKTKGQKTVGTRAWPYLVPFVASCWSLSHCPHRFLSSGPEGIWPPSSVAQSSLVFIFTGLFLSFPLPLRLALFFPRYCSSLFSLAVRLSSRFSSVPVLWLIFFFPPF